MSKLALYIGKFLCSSLRKLGRGSAYPGQKALQLDPQIISRFKLPDQVIFVTGTNGKTSTTHYIANIFQTAGYRVMTNVEGANMAQGIATELLRMSNLNYEIQADVAVFEIDEGSLPKIIEELVPSHLVMLNLFPDQEDRYGSVDELAARLNDSIIQDLTLILNANDPRLAWIGSNQMAKKKIYYGVEKVNFQQPYHHIKCPVCNESLIYDFSHYEHLGYYHCSTCDFEIPEIDYMAEEVQLENQSFTVDHYHFNSPQPTAYTLFNATAAIAIAKELGVDNESIKNGIDSSKVIKGRNEVVTLGEKDVKINLAKNPASMNQSISYLLSKQKSPYQLILSINNFKADGISIRWLTETDFNRLNDSPLEEIFVTGSVRDDLYDILLEQGIDEDKLSTENEETAIEKAKSSPLETYIIANYTALYELYKIIEK